MEDSYIFLDIKIPAVPAVIKDNITKCILRNYKYMKDMNSNTRYKFNSWLYSTKYALMFEMGMNVDEIVNLLHMLQKNTIKTYTIMIKELECYGDVLILNNGLKNYYAFWSESKSLIAFVNLDIPEERLLLR